MERNVPETRSRSNGIQNNIDTKSTDPQTGLQLRDTVADSHGGSDKIEPSSISDDTSRDNDPSPGMTEESRHQTDPQTGLQLSDTVADSHG